MKGLILKFAIVLGALFPIGIALANEPTVAYASSDPSSEQLYIELTDGVSLLMDKATDRIYLNRPGQQEVSRSFAQAVEGTSDVPGVRADNLAKLRGLLSDPSFLATIRDPRVATDASIWELPDWEWCGDVICISPHADRVKQHEPLSQASLGRPRARLCEHYLCPTIPMPCELGPCSVSTWDNGSFFYSGWGGGWGDEEGGGTVTQQDLIAWDRENFERERQGACKSKKIHAANTVAMGVVMGGSCASGTLPVCLASAVMFAISFGQMNDSHEQCNREYPGRGNW